jgi:hypothetical protein
MSLLSAGACAEDRPGPSHEALRRALEISGPGTAADPCSGVRVDGCTCVGPAVTALIVHDDYHKINTSSRWAPPARRPPSQPACRPARAVGGFNIFGRFQHSGGAVLQRCAVTRHVCRELCSRQRRKLESRAWPRARCAATADVEAASQRAWCWVGLEAAWLSAQARGWQMKTLFEESCAAHARDSHKQGPCVACLIEQKHGHAFPVVLLGQRDAVRGNLRRGRATSPGPCGNNPDSHSTARVLALCSADGCRARGCHAANAQAGCHEARGTDCGRMSHGSRRTVKNLSGRSLRSKYSFLKVLCTALHGPHQFWYTSMTAGSAGREGATGSLLATAGLMAAHARPGRTQGHCACALGCCGGAGGPQGLRRGRAARDMAVLLGSAAPLALQRVRRFENFCLELHLARQVSNERHREALSLRAGERDL